MNISHLSTASAEEALATLERKAPARERALALGRLATVRGKRYDERAAQLLRDRSEELPVRVEAALALGRSDHPQRTKLLVRELRDPADVVRFAALRSLAFHGGPEAFEAVRGLEPTLGDCYVAREAAYAQALLAYRWGLDEGTLREPVRMRPTGVGSKATELVLAKESLPEDKARSIHAGLGEVALAVEPSTRWTYALECGFHQLAVIVDRAFDAPDSLGRLFARKCVLLAVVDQDYEPEIYAPRFHLLAHPGKQDGVVELNALDLRGRRIMAGRGVEKGGALEFELSPLEVARAFPTAIRGSFDPRERGLVFDEAWSARERPKGDAPRLPKPG